jgi:hypothetical protein
MAVSLREHWAMEYLIPFGLDARSALTSLAVEPAER